MVYSTIYKKRTLTKMISELDLSEILNLCALVDILAENETDEKNLILNQNQMEKELYPVLDGFVKESVKKFNIDDSHGVGHARNVAYFAKTILRELDKDKNEDKNNNEDNKVFLTDSVRKIIFISAYLHDTVDSKYGAESNIDSLVEFLKSHNISEEEIQTIKYVILHMSFSKRRSNISNSLPEFGTTDPKLIKICEIVADADMLDTYNPLRSELYQSVKFDHMKNTKEYMYLVKTWTKTMFVKRVLLYRDVWFRTDAAKNICEPFHIAAEKYLLENLSDVDVQDY